MANLATYEALYSFVQRHLSSAAHTEDDALIIDALLHDDICHVCQPIRDIHTDEEKFQHLTLRFGGNSEQSVYCFDLSRKMTFCLDLYSLYLAVRHISFRLEVSKPQSIDNLVVPLQAETLNWPLGQAFLLQLFTHHSMAMAHITPCLQLHHSGLDRATLSKNIQSLASKAASLWIDIHTPSEYLDVLAKCEPDAIKVSQSMETKEMRLGLIPIVRLTRKLNISFIAGRIATQDDLNQFKLLGTSYYFGYISDIPSKVEAIKIRLIS